MVEDTVIPEPEGVGAVMPLSFSSIRAGDGVAENN